MSPVQSFLLLSGPPVWLLRVMETGSLAGNVSSSPSSSSSSALDHIGPTTVALFKFVILLFHGALLSRPNAVRAASFRGLLSQLALQIRGICKAELETRGLASLLS